MSETTINISNNKEFEKKKTIKRVIESKKTLNKNIFIYDNDI